MYFLPLLVSALDCVASYTGRICTTCKGPIHSWSTLPVSFHSSSDSTGPTGAFTNEDLEVIKRFPLVTIEKWQGENARQFRASPTSPSNWSCHTFNCDCQGMADYYGKSNWTTWGCAPPQARTWWIDRKCHADANCGLCQRPGCSIPGAEPCYQPPPSGSPVFLWEEDAWVAAATQIKNANPNISVAVWMDTMLIYTGWNTSGTGLNTTLNPDIKPPCTTGHFRCVLVLSS